MRGQAKHGLRVSNVKIIDIHYVLLDQISQNLWIVWDKPI